MKTTIHIVQGEHPSVPGNPMTAHATRPLADVRARELVNIIREEVLYDPVTAEYSLLLPQLTGEFDWQEALREWQRAKIADDYDAEELAKLDDDDLADAAETVVWITELPLELPAVEPMFLAGCDDPELMASLATAEPGALMPAPPSRVLVGVHGGQVQWCFADRPGIRVDVVDFDVEGDAGPGQFDYRLFTDTEGDTGPARLWEENVAVDAAFIAQADASPECDSEGEIADEGGAE